MLGWPRKSRSTFGSRGSQRYWWFCLMNFHNFFRIPCFRGQGIHCWHSYWGYHVWVTSKILVNFPYKRYSKVLMIESYIYLKILYYLCFWGQGTHCRYVYWATMFGWLQKFRSTFGSRGSQRYWWFCLMNYHNFFSFRNFFTVYVFDVEESIVDIPAELPCSDDLENLGQLPVLEVFEVTQRR